MTTQQAIEALHALPRLGQGTPGLARMQTLMDHRGNPEKDLQCIHIAGTNGKGSLAAMTSSILTAAGYKTGLTISPYVVDFRERFQIDGEMIPPRTLASLAQKVLDAIDAIELEGGEIPVQFEAVTALALLWFAREKCDLVVLETGLGGRCDATNIVPNKLVAAITKIGLDHTEILGDTPAAWQAPGKPHRLRRLQGQPAVPRRPSGQPRRHGCGNCPRPLAGVRLRHLRRCH